MREETADTDAMKNDGRTRPRFPHQLPTLLQASVRYKQNSRRRNDVIVALLCAELVFRQTQCTAMSETNFIVEYDRSTEGVLRTYSEKVSYLFKIYASDILMDGTDAMFTHYIQPLTM